MKQERLLHFDLLRILACFGVIMLHAAAPILVWTTG